MPFAPVRSPTKASGNDVSSPITEAANFIHQHFQSAETFTAQLHAILPDKFSSLSADNRALVDCIGTVIYSAHSDSHNSLSSQISDQQATIQDLNNQISKQQSELSQQKDDISELKATVETLKTSLLEQQTHTKKLESYIESIDTYQRRESLILSGEDLPNESTNEDSTKVAIHLIKSKLNYTISPEDISVAHRLGQKSDKKRALIVKFVRRSLKHNVVRKCIELKPKFGVSESLSPYRRKIYSTLRLVKGPKGTPSEIAQLHTNEGTIVIKLASGNVYHKIHDENTLNKFLEGHPNINELYEEKWNSLQ